MSDLELMPWDSEVLDARIARVSDVTCIPSASKMDEYDLVIARLPMQWDEGRELYQNAGFDFVTLDINMSVQQIKSIGKSTSAFPMIWLKKSPPMFLIEGFQINDSRLMRDSRCRGRLKEGFWDDVIQEHCASFSDRVACVLSQDKSKLIGVVSCIEFKGGLELFLVAVHPAYQSHGVGTQLMSFVSQTAMNEGLSLRTQVLVTNTRAINFYLKHGFLVGTGEVVLHRWKETIIK